MFELIEAASNSVGIGVATLCERGTGPTAALSTDCHPPWQPRQTSRSVLLARAAFAGSQCAAATKQPFSRGATAVLAFFLFLSTAPSPLFCFYRVLEGTYLASVRICPFQCTRRPPTTTIVGRWVGGLVGMHQDQSTYIFSHTHILLLFFLIYVENRIVKALKGQKHVAVSSYVCLADHFYTDRGQVPPSSSLTSSKSNPQQGCRKRGGRELCVEIGFYVDISQE